MRVDRQMWPFDKKSRGVSLHEEMQSYGSLQQMIEELVGAYRGALDSLMQHTPKTSAAGAPDWRKNIRQLRARFDTSLSIPVVKETAKAVNREIAVWGSATESHFERQEKETKEAMAAVAVMAEVLSAQEQTYGVRFRGISKKLRILTTSNDIAEIRRKLQSEIELLEQYVDAMAADSRSALGSVRQLQRAEARPDDAVAGPDVAQAIRSNVTTGDRVSVVVVSLPAGASRQHGAMVQARLSEAFECRDLAGPVSGGLYLAVTRLSLPETAARLEVVERDLSAKLGMAVDSSAFEKPPGMSVAEMMGKVAAAVEEAPAA